MSESFSVPESTKEKEKQNFNLEADPEYLGFKSVEVTLVDESKPWKPAKEVTVTKEDGSKEEAVNANKPFFIFRDKNGKEMTVSAAASGHIDSLHIKGTEAGSQFEVDSLQELFQDVAKNLPSDVSESPGVSAFSMEMGKSMGAEGLASMSELLDGGKLSQEDIDNANAFRDECAQLNAEGSEEEKQSFIDMFDSKHPESKIKFISIRGGVVVPSIDSPKQDTTKLFMVFGPGSEEGDDRKTLYTAAPGRNMPRHPNPAEHKGADGELNTESFKESSDAWFDTVMLTGE